MKKVIVLIVAISLSLMLGVTNVFAEEAIPVVAEPSQFDNWVNTFTDFASLKNFLVTMGSGGLLIMLIKVRGAWKYFKSPKGIAVIETIGFNILNKITDKPDMVIKISNIVLELPLIKTIVANGTRKAAMYEVEILDKIVNLEAKLAANVFEDNPTANQQAILLLEKLRDEYETI